MKSNLIFVHQDIYNEFRDSLLSASSELVVGDPAKEATFVGPLVNEQSAIQIQDVKPRRLPAISFYYYRYGNTSCDL